MPLFGSFFKNKDKTGKQSSLAVPSGPPKPTWTDAWKRSEVGVVEIAELIHTVTQVLKAKGRGNSPIGCFDKYLRL
jgi:hypothetical protein